VDSYVHTFAFLKPYKWDIMASRIESSVRYVSCINHY